MTEDSVFFGLVSLIWIVLAALCAFMPMFAVPGSAVVWGSGAAVFVALAVIIAITERRMPQTPKRALRFKTQPKENCHVKI